MQLKKIEYFIKIVELGSLSKAAECLYLTQPTLSRFLEKLEDEMGAKLFVRSRNNSLKLTECGEKYYLAALQIDEIRKKLERDVADCAGQGGGKTVSIGVSDDHSQIYVSGCIDKVKERYPDIAVNLFFYGAAELPQLVENGELDIASSAYFDESALLEYAHVNKTEVDMVVSHQNPLARYSYNIEGQRETRIMIKDIYDKTPLVLIHEPTVLRQEEMRYFKKMKFEPNIRRTYIRHATVADIISRSDDLVGFCPRRLKSDKMAYIALDPPFYYKSAVFYRKDKRLSEAERYIIELLKNRPDERDI